MTDKNSGTNVVEKAPYAYMAIIARKRLVNTFNTISIPFAGIKGLGVRDL